MTATPVHIYGPSFSNFVRTVMLVCEEKQIDYTVGFEVNGNEIAFKGEQHLSWHPFGKIPVLLESNNEEVTFSLSETASICRYLDHNNELQPENKALFAEHDALCAMISIDIDKVLLREYLLEFAFPKGDDNQVRIDIVKDLQTKVADTLSAVSQMLDKGNILSADQFTVADALITPMLHYISCLPEGFNLLPDFPKLELYLEKMMTRPSCKKVLLSKKL